MEALMNSYSQLAGFDKRGKGWDHKQGMSRNAAEDLALGFVRTRDAARQIGMTIAELTSNFRGGPLHHFCGSNGRIVADRTWDVESLMDQMACELRMYIPRLRSESAKLRLVQHAIQIRRPHLG